MNMSWRESFEQLLGSSPVGNGGTSFESHNPMDTMDRMDTIKQKGNSVHLVHSVHTPQGSSSAPCCELLSDTELAECAYWPPETQRVWAAAVTHFEKKAYPTVEAEILAFVMVRELIKRRGTRHLILISDLPPKVGKAMELGLEVFPGTHIQWRPNNHNQGDDQIG